MDQAEKMTRAYRFRRSDLCLFGWCPNFTFSIHRLHRSIYRNPRNLWINKFNLGHYPFSWLGSYRAAVADADDVVTVSGRTPAMFRRMRYKPERAQRYSVLPSASPHAMLCA